MPLFAVALEGKLQVFTKDERGSITFIAALGMIVILGFLAMAIDVGQLRYQRLYLQHVADAAALAAMLEVNFCGGTPNCANMQSAARTSAIENGMTPNTMVTNCGAAPATGTVLMISNPPCALGNADPNSGKPTYVEVMVTQPQATLFAGLLGFASVPLTARAEAAASGQNCVYSLDSTGSGALTVALLANVVAPCGIMVESTSASAVSCLAGAITAPKLLIGGGAVNLLCPSPTPSTYISLPSPADPLAYLPPLALPPCGTTTTTPYHGSPAAVTVLGSAVFYPDGAYCGGITILSGSTVFFQQGTYALTSANGGAVRLPGGLTVNLGTSVSGTGVTFYNYGPSGGISFIAPTISLAGVQLAAPTTGPYAGILFFQPSNNTSPATLLASSSYNTVLQGAYYFPKATATLALNGIVDYDILVANDVVFTTATFGSTTVGTSTFSNNYTSLANGSPVGGTGAVVSQ